MARLWPWTYLILASWLTLQPCRCASAQSASPSPLSRVKVKDMGFTKDQIGDIKQIKWQAYQAIVALRSQRSLTPAQRHDRLRSIQQQAITKIRAVLTPVQLAKFNAMLAPAKQSVKQAKRSAGSSKPNPIQRGSPTLRGSAAAP
jgi:hypothetical protein